MISFSLIVGKRILVASLLLAGVSLNMSAGQFFPQKDGHPVMLKVETKYEALEVGILLEGAHLVFKNSRGGWMVSLDVWSHSSSDDQRGNNRKNRPASKKEAQVLENYIAYIAHIDKVVRSQAEIEAAEELFRQQVIAREIQREFDFVVEVCQQVEQFDQTQLVQQMTFLNQEVIQLTQQLNQLIRQNNQLQFLGQFVIEVGQMRRLLEQFAHYVQPVQPELMFQRNIILQILNGINLGPQAYNKMLQIVMDGLLGPQRTGLILLHILHGRLRAMLDGMPSIQED